MKLCLIGLALTAFIGCSKPVDGFYCGRISRMCYTKSQLPKFEEVSHSDYTAQPTAFCFNGYLDATPLGFQRSYTSFRSCYVSMSECQTQRLVDDFKWVDGTISNCSEDRPDKGGTGYDLKQYQE